MKRHSVFFRFGMRLLSVILLLYLQAASVNSSPTMTPSREILPPHSVSSSTDMAWTEVINVTDRGGSGCQWSSGQMECCSECGDNARVKEACNETHDTICECNRERYWDEEAQSCQPCDLCPHGWGISRSCTPSSNTICHKCPEGTYSSALSAWQGCIACSECRDRDILFNCTPIQDTVCGDKQIGRIHRKTTSKPNFIVASDVEEDRTNVISVYCLILAAVILGLLCYVVLKRWRRNRKLSSKASSVAMNVTNSELTSFCPQTLQHPSATTNEEGFVLLIPEPRDIGSPVSMSSRLRDIPSFKRREIEMLLIARRDRKDWKDLAKCLGYPSSRIAVFEHLAERKHNNPTRMLFADWSKDEDATVHRLVHALKAIGRFDVIRLLFPPCEWCMPQIKGQIV